MRGISWKAVAIANVVHVVVLILVVTPLVVIGQIVLHPIYPNATTHELDEIMSSSQVFLATTVLLCTITSPVAAGYIGGRIAKDHFLLNGAMGTIVLALVGLYELVFISSPQSVPHVPAWLDKLSDVVNAIVWPMMGALGGHFAKLRQTNLAAMSPQERAARGIGADFITAIRWVLAFALASIVYVAVVILAAKTVGPFRWLPAIAVTLAILSGTLTLPSSHRKIGCLLLIAVSIIVPFAVLLLHVRHGDANNGYSLTIMYNAFGSFLTYQSLESSGLLGAPNNGRWWWLSTYQAARISKVERNMRRYLCLVGMIIGVLVYLFVLADAGAMGVDSHITVVLFILTLPFGFVVARPVCAYFWPDRLQEADRAAALRLGAASFNQLG